MKLVIYVVKNFLGSRGNDLEAFCKVDTVNGNIYNEGLKNKTCKGEKTDFDIENEEARHYHENIRNEKGAANIHFCVLL